MLVWCLVNHLIVNCATNDSDIKMLCLHHMFSLAVALFLHVHFGHLKATPSNVPIGHGKPLGNHRDSDGHVDILTTLPTPQQFWDKYVSKRKPVLFHGAAKSSPGFHLWTDHYMLENFGDLKVRIEGKIQDRESYPEGEKGIAQDTLRNVLNTYRTRSVHVVSQTPDPMAKQVMVLPFLTCGTFSKRILESTFWLGGYGTQSALHTDADNAINCLFNGTKDWIMIDQKYEHLFSELESKGYSQRSFINADYVDLVKYPQFSEVRYTHVHMKAGDCLFIPASYWHQVNSYGVKNMAVSIMISRLKEVDLSDCKDAQLDFKPMTEVNMVYTYDGYSEQTMGDMDPFELEDVMKELCRRKADLTQADIFYNFNTEDDQEIIDNKIGTQDHLMDENLELQDKIKQIVQLLDTNTDNMLSCHVEILPKLSLETLKAISHILAFDPTNTEEYEFVKLSKNIIRAFLEHIITKLSQTESLGQEQFNSWYQAIGGSQKAGTQIFNMMDTSQQGFITRDMVLNKMEDIINLYDQKGHQHDYGLEGLNQESLTNEVGSNQQWQAHPRVPDEL